MRRLALSALALLLACGPRPAGVTDEPAPDTDVADDAAGGLPPEQYDPPTSRHPGVGHTAQIAELTLAPDGSAALTRDTLGSLRLWPALDGTAEPQVVPVRNANQFSVARLGERFSVFAVDGSGGARLIEMSEDGQSRPLASLPPTSPVLEGHVLADGSVLVLFKDRSVALVDAKGKPVAKFDERRFRPERLLVSVDGRTAVALISKAREDAKAKTELVPLRIDAKTKTITRTGNPRLAVAQMGFSPHNAALSPDGTSFAFLDRHDGSAFHVGVIRLDDNEPPKTFTAAMRSHGGIGVGFVDDRRLIVSPGDGSLATLIDLEDGSMRPRPGPPNDFNHQGRAQRVRAGRQAFGYGSWLYVQDVAEGKHRFLGYDTVQAQSVAISEGGAHVAWGFLLGSVLIESTEPGGPQTTIELETPNMTPWKLRFVDDEHLLVIDGLGNIELHRWRQRRIVARAGLIGSMRNLDFEPATGLLALDRHFNDVRLFRVEDGAVQGPWLVNDGATRFGLLTAKSSNDPVLWTLDSQSRLRRYTMAQLEEGLAMKDVEKLGEELKRGQPAPMALGRDGRQFGARYDSGTYQVFVELDDRIEAVKAPSSNITAMHVAPDGKTVAAVSASNNSTVALLDAQTLQLKWQFGGGGFVTDVSWAPDASSLALATQTGAVVLDATTGEMTAKRCGLGFRAVHAPPNTAFSAVNQRAVCEQ